jgi:tetratricopeptide (TPR) repeat protein
LDLSKIGKLIKNPGGFFADAVRKKVIGVPAKKPKKTVLLAVKPVIKVDGKLPAAPRSSVVVSGSKPEFASRLAVSPAKTISATAKINAERQPAVKSIQNTVFTKPILKNPPVKIEDPAVVARKTFFKGLTEFLKTMMLDGDYETLEKASLHAFSDVQGPEEAIELLSLCAEGALARGDHESLMHTANRISAEYNSKIGHLYRAKSYFVRGMYNEAKQALLILLHERPAHAEGIYLLGEIAGRTNEPGVAWRALERLAKVSKRNETWHAMSSLVNNNSDMMRLLENWEDWKKSAVGRKYHKDASEFAAMGALRCGNYELAKSIWRKSMFSALNVKTGFKLMVTRKPSYSRRRAQRALADINRVLKASRIDMFLVGGTLLGCMRENELLGHAKDIDVGIWANAKYEALSSAIIQSGLFYMIKSRSSQIIRLRHVNGVSINIFYHSRKKDDYWHGDNKIICHNSQFKIKNQEFLGDTYLIPENYDLYLTENYGDWKIPKINFDGAFDKPNSEIVSENEMCIHTFEKLIDSCVDSDWLKVSFYLSKLETYGESYFVEKFKNKIELKLKIFLPSSERKSYNIFIDQENNELIPSDFLLQKN